MDGGLSNRRSRFDPCTVSLVMKFREMAVLFSLLVLGYNPSCSWSQETLQSRYSRPISPTLSPYLGLLREESGVLPNYYQFVRPQQQIQQSLSAQAGAIERQRQELGQIERRLGNSLSQQDRRRNGSAITGSGSGFLRYSHFYPEPKRR